MLMSSAGHVRSLQSMEKPGSFPSYHELYTQAGGSSPVCIVMKLCTRLPGRELTNEISLSPVAQAMELSAAVLATALVAGAQEPSASEEEADKQQGTSDQPSLQIATAWSDSCLVGIADRGAGRCVRTARGARQGVCCGGRARRLRGRRSTWWRWHRCRTGRTGGRGVGDRRLRFRGDSWLGRLARRRCRTRCRVLLLEAFLPGFIPVGSGRARRFGCRRRARGGAGRTR